jgi:transcription initiation factor TFIID subunit TAF12
LVWIELGIQADEKTSSGGFNDVKISQRNGKLNNADSTKSAAYSQTDPNDHGSRSGPPPTAACGIATGRAVV